MLMEDYDDERRFMAIMGIKESPHFTQSLYNEAVDGMVNEDGTKGPHYSLEEVQKIVEKYGIDLIENNLLDFAFVLNMVWSDYFDAIPDNEKSYVQVAKAFLFDEDGPKGKAVRYWVAMKYPCE